ncbi:MAG TPA: cadmium resistance transporter [Vicinamibacterales bacterium]|nr:cadmium resistance transporter [Vicinamibacterales bacterium]
MLGVAIVVFASTNIDDIFLLTAFFADSHLTTRSVLIGQFAGIGVLVVTSAVAALAAIALPEGWVALLGLVPLALGIRRAWQLRKSTAAGSGASGTPGTQNRDHRLDQATRSQILAVMSVTMANGGDNLSVYIPLFAKDFRMIPVYAAVFAVMTAVWCAVAYGMVNNRIAGQHVRQYGQIALPFVLIALGLYILSDAIGLLR